MDRWTRRHTAAAFPVAVVRRLLEDRASNLAALIAYYAFFSLFPLLLALVSFRGFVLQDNPSLQDEVLDSALARNPGHRGAAPGRHRLRGLLVLLVLGLALIAVTVITGLAIGGRIGPWADRLGAVVGALAANLAVFLAAFGLLTARPLRIRVTSSARFTRASET